MLNSGVRLYDLLQYLNDFDTIDSHKIKVRILCHFASFLYWYNLV